jgi:DNA-binding PadR family transcriptional regulator
MTDLTLGEFGLVVLLAILKEGERAFALEVRRSVEEDLGRSVSRGAFYTTLERLKKKGLVDWVAAQPANARRSGTLRKFSVTPKGMESLRNTHRVLQERSAMLVQALEKP